MDMEITKDEYDILIESVDCWVSKDFGDALFSGLITSIAFRDAPPDVKAEMKKKEDEDNHKRKEAKQLRKEQGILLKAKLLRLRDAIEAKNFCENSQT